MRSSPVLVFAVFMAIFVPLFMILIQEDNVPTNNTPLVEKSPSAIGFPPLILCTQTDGEWASVPAADYPLSESEGIYNPTTDMNTNYKCFCPVNKNWNADRGCE